MQLPTFQFTSIDGQIFKAEVFAVVAAVVYGVIELWGGFLPDALQPILSLILGYTASVATVKKQAT